MSNIILVTKLFFEADTRKMLDINEEKEINLIKIFGKEKYQKWLKKYPIMGNNDVLSWIRDKIFKFTSNGKQSNKFSITSYLETLQKYCIFNHVKNPSELLNEDIDKRNLRLRTYLHFLLNEVDEEKFKEIGFNRKPSEVTVKNLTQSRIKSFYSDRGKNISYGMKTAKVGKNYNEIRLTKSLIRQIQDRIRVPNYKLISASQSQLGLRIGDVSEELVKGNYKIQKHIDHFYIKNFKTEKYEVVINYLFFTEDLTNTLLSVYGNICNNDLTKLDLSKILQTRNKNVVDISNYLNDLKRIVNKLGIEENIKTHSFRKYFSSQIRKCKKVDDEFREHLMAHSSYNLSKAYNNNLKDIEWFYGEWLKVNSFININIIDKTSDKLREHSKEFIKIKNKNQILEEQVYILIKQKRESNKKIAKLEETQLQILEQMKYFRGFYKDKLKEITEKLGFTKPEKRKKIILGKK